MWPERSMKQISCKPKTPAFGLAAQHVQHVKMDKRNLSQLFS